MNLAKKLLMTTGEAAGGNIPSGGYVDDVFSTYLYTGNGNSQTINNGIDLAGEGGLVWIKQRSSSTPHFLTDTIRGATNTLLSNDVTGNTVIAGGLTNFVSSGFSVASNSPVNSSSGLFASWTFRRAPKFFDVVTYTGNGVAGRQIAHSLGVQAGFVTVKATSTTGDWNSYHRSATGDLKLNLTDAQTASRAIITAADASTFTVSGTANNNGVQYVAYVFAHDPSAEGIIQCGSFTGNTTVNIGWEPQWIMIKRTDAAGDWIVIDSMRGCSVGGVDAVLNPNLTNAESVSNDYIDFTATGFITKNLNGTYIYTVIRRPNKPPTIGTQVYNAIARNGNGSAAEVYAGFAPDLVIHQDRARHANLHCRFRDRLRGTVPALLSTSSGKETTVGTDTLTGYLMDGVSVGADTTEGGINASAAFSYIYHLFRRAPGFMDVVCYAGNGVARTVSHSLGVVPELIIVKNRTSPNAWYVYSVPTGNGNRLVLNDTVSYAANPCWNNTTPTSSVFNLSAYGDGVNDAPNNYVAYLFASFPGISKVGSYSGNGGTQTIPCGFTTGSRFILIKRIDNTGDWFVWDTARGITPTTDPHLSLNTTAAEVTTDDSIDQDASGFIVNQNAATNINALGGNYLFLAIA